MAATTPKPKPWETGATANGNAAASSSKPSAFDAAIASSSSSSLAGAPALPDRPAEFAGGALATSPYGGMANSALQSRYSSPYGGMSSYGGMGGYGGGMSAYSSPYSRMGGMGGLGGMGGYGGYGSYGGGGYGMGGYGVGNMGAPGEGFPTLTSSVQQTTAPAFAVLESLVTAFTSLAQLVESTYMATHSSFFAMVGVADQLGSLKTYLGQVLGVFSILRLGRRIIAWLRGKKVRTDGWANEWSHGGALSVPGSAGPGTIDGPRPSGKPLLLFLLSAVGLPYLMSRLIKLLIRSQQAQQAQAQQAMLEANGQVDPTKLTFARAKWEFKGQEEWELTLGRDEIVAVMEKREGKEGGEGWWRGRTRDGRIGWFPGNYVEVIRRREDPAGADPPK